MLHNFISHIFTAQNMYFRHQTIYMFQKHIYIYIYIYNWNMYLVNLQAYFNYEFVWSLLNHVSTQLWFISVLGVCINVDKRIANTQFKCPWWPQHGRLIIFQWNFVCLKEWEIWDVLLWIAANTSDHNQQNLWQIDTGRDINCSYQQSRPI